ncbi:CocE/NonD family hydrolase [Chloroflexota bacterium]
MKELRNVMVPMRDGVQLAVDIYIPDGSGPFPALFSMSAYGKEVQAWSGIYPTFHEIGDLDYFINKGYAWVVADSRGKYPSEGRFNLLDKEEQQDGYELVEWIAHQPWCNGSVGGMGMSYFTMINYLIAALQPPSLKTIVAIGGLFDLYRDVIYYGGLYHSGFLHAWLGGLQEGCYPPECIAPSENWQPPSNLVQDAVKNSTDGPYYEERSLSSKYDKVKVPVYQIIGPTTLTHRAMFKAYQSLNVPKKLMVGTGSAFHFLYTEPVSHEIGRWFDYWLKGIDTGIMEEPRVIIHVPGAEEWRYEQDYPIERTVWTNFYLRTGENTSASEPPYGLLSQDMPGEDKPDSYSYPESQRKVASEVPVLAFSTPPLKQDMEITGPGSLVLYASSTTDDTPWIVRIDDEAPDGSISVIGFGWLRASHRELDNAKSMPGRPFHTHKNPTLIEPNKVYMYEIEIFPMIRAVKAGHRLRLRIASSDFAGRDGPIQVSFRHRGPVVNTIYHDRQYPSHLVLPLIPPATSPIELRPNMTYVPDPLASKKWLGFHEIPAPEPRATTSK